MFMKVSLGSIRSANKEIGKEIEKVSNSGQESLEEYVRLINLVREGFSRNSKRFSPGSQRRIT
ncbi:MAG: hypothetical protein ACOCV7_03790 [Desulfonatronovibrionaceae bacterium]